MNPEQIGRRLTAMRGSRTQAEAAKAIGVTPAALSQYESGARVPRDEIKIAIAKYYDTSVQNIFFADEVNS